MLQKICGMPFYRLAKLQKLHNIPIAMSTMWEQCAVFWAESGSYIYNELQNLTANSNNLFTDDTRARILEVKSANKLLPKKEQRGCNTTVVCANTRDEKEIILYVSANRHCGENIGKLLEYRDVEGERIKLMSDASSQNNVVIEKDIPIVRSNCLAHGRRKFHELLEFYPDECSYFLQEIGRIYKNEERCAKLSGKEKLDYRKQHSLIHINNIYNKIHHLFKEKLVEPNSSLGKAMNYWVRHKRGLMRFLQIEDAAIDNNKSERALKDIILQRKNSLFFKSLSSAEVLSGISSIIKTCAANGINAFGYLNWIQENWQKVQKSAKDYLPWHYSLGPPVVS